MLVICVPDANSHVTRLSCLRRRPRRFRATPVRLEKLTFSDLNTSENVIGQTAVGIPAHLHACLL